MTDTPIRLALGSVGLALYPARPLRHLSAGLYVPANRRGVMAAGLAGEVRVRAGREVEEELLRLQPLSLGRAYRTNPGKLAADGVEVLAHAVTSNSPGETAKPGQSDRALRAALELFEDAGVRAVTLPLVEILSGDPGPEQQGQAFGRLLTGHLRRRSRIRQVTVAGLDHHFLAGLEAYLRDAGALLVDDEPAGD